MLCGAETAEDLFRLKNIQFDSKKCLATNEQAGNVLCYFITCIDGSSKFLYFGTSNGGVVRVELQESHKKECNSGSGETNANAAETTSSTIVVDDNAETVSCAVVLDFMQLPTKSAVTQLIAVPAVDSLIVLSASKLFYIDIFTLQIQSASNSSNVVCLSLNNDPLTDDPFTLQMAFGTTNRLLLVGEKSMSNTMTNPAQGTGSGSGSVSAAAFSALKGSVSSSSSASSSNLSTTLIKQRFQANAIIQTLCYSRECICYATANEYFVYNLNGNIHLSLFPYDSTLVKPLILNIDTEEFLVSSMHGLAVFAKCTGVSSRPPLCWGSDAVLGSAYHSPYIFAFTEQSLLVFECNEGVEVCRLKLHDATLLSNIDGRIYIGYKNAKLFIVSQISWLERAETLLSKSCVDEALKFAEQSVLEASYDEAEILILIHYAHLELPSFGGICNLDSDCTAIKLRDESRTKPSDSMEYLNFLLQYLSEIRKLYWTKAYRKDLDNVLVCLLSVKHDNDTDSDNGKIMPPAQQMPAQLECSLNDCKEWLMKRNSFLFFVLLAFHLDDFKEAFGTCRELFRESKLTTRLHELCMENLSKGDGALLFRVKDAKILLDALQFLIEFDPRTSVESLKNIQYVDYDRVEVMKYLEPYPNELILFLEQKKPCWQEDASEECLETLLNEYEDYDAAEFYCQRMQARNKRLFRVLLKAYLKIVKIRPEFKTRIVQMLSAVHETGDELEIIAEFPDDWPLQALAPFASKAFSSYTYRLHCDQLKTAALSRAMRHLNQQLEQQCNAKVVIDEHTRCAVCSKLIGADDTVLYPRSNVLIHRTCMNTHCPKT
ncbi:unnamed protein product [Anisakis simplex]|uniref:CNH domain-containing protein n=1 Tax=Anisakis simplex TaxID=6269 RepID=A0A0M3K1W5_ANISI|nr:unnamed protein product [Anisakis simplex]